MEEQTKKRVADPIITWDIDISILSNTPVMKQLLFVIVISIVFVVALMFVIGLLDGDMSLEYLAFLGKLFLIMAGIFAVLILLGVLLVMGNRYGYTFTLDSIGIAEATHSRQYKRNTIINALLVIVGLLSGRPAAAGAGILAQSRQKQFLRWKDIDQAVVDSRRKTVTLKKNRRIRMIVFCTMDNYEPVSKLILEKTQ